MYSVDHVSYCGEASVCTNIGVYICVCSVMRFPRTHSRRTQNAHTPGAHKLPPAQVRRNAGARNWGGAQVHRKIHILGTPRSCVSGGEFPHTRTNTLAGNLHCVHFLKEPAGCAREWEAQMHPLWLHAGPPFCILRDRIRCADRFEDSENTGSGSGSIRLSGHIVVVHCS